MIRMRESESWDPDRHRARGYSRFVAGLTVVLVVLFVAAWVSLGFAAVAHAAESALPAKPGVTAATVAKAPAPIATTPAVSAFRVNVNLADSTQLLMVPGIGPTKAKAIVAYRVGKTFQSPADLMKVKGIGPKSYAKMKMHLAVDGPPVQGTPPRR